MNVRRYRCRKQYQSGRESMACRKTAHTHTDRAVTGSSNVTLGWKTDANAGTTAASGCGNPVPRLVGEVEVASDLARCRNAVVGESGLIRIARKCGRCFERRLGHELPQDQCGSSCAARQSRPVCDDLGVMSRRAETKGLRGIRIRRYVMRSCNVAIVSATEYSKTPSRDVS